MIKTFAILLAVAAIPTGSIQRNDQTPLQKLTTRLTGNGSKVWVFERMVKSLGGAKCRQGRVYTFRSNHRLQVEFCDKEKKTVSTQTYSWTLEIDGAQKFVLTYGDQSFVLDFFTRQDAPGKEFMRLRRLSTSAAVHTEDSIFQHQPL